MEITELLIKACDHPGIPGHFLEFGRNIMSYFENIVQSKVKNNFELENDCDITIGKYKNFSLK